MRVSIVIPSWNSGRYLATTLQSIKRQNYDDIEVIIVDGGSDDNTTDVIQDFRDLPITFVRQSDAGQLDAVQKGLQLASGDVCLWMNADDVVMPGAFRYVVREFELDPSLDIVYSDNFAFRDDIKALYVGPTIRGLTYFDHALFYRQMYSECIYWRRRVTTFVPQPFTSFRVYTDYAFFLNLRRGRKAKWVPKRLGAFRIVCGQASQRFQQQKRVEFKRIRKYAYARCGWAPAQVAALKFLWAPVFAVRQQLYPTGNRLVRWLLRCITKDQHRKTQTELFFKVWLADGYRASDPKLILGLFR